MRYADGPSMRCDVHVDAAPTRVWELVTDIELPARLSPELQRVEWLNSATRPLLGASFVGHNQHRVLGEWRSVSHVVELEDERVFGWAVVDPDGRFGGATPDPAVPLATWRFGVEPAPRGTWLWQSVRIGPARSGLSLAIDRMPEREEALVAHRLNELRASIEVTLSGIKNLAEERAT
jgi:hypothetical protein